MDFSSLDVTSLVVGFAIGALFVAMLGHYSRRR
jgi:hypothetical protein